MGKDLTEEGLVRLKDVPKSPLIGPRRNGGRLNIRTVFRWATRGVGGVVLETLVQGGQRYTTGPALLRFFRSVTASKANRGSNEKESKRKLSDLDNKAIDYELDQMGI